MDCKRVSNTDRPVQPAAVMAPRRLVLRGAMLGLATAPLAGCGWLSGIFDDDEKPIIFGKREAVLGTKNDGLMAEAGDTRPVALGPLVSNGSWEQPGRVPDHVAGHVALGGLKPLWHARIGSVDSGRAALTAQPVVAQNRVFTMDGDGTVSAFGLQDGAEAWKFVTRPKKQRSSNMGGGLSYADGVVYVVDGLAEALALDAGSGKVIWRVPIGAPGRSAPTVVDGRMFFGTIDERLIALDTRTGKTLWSYQATEAATIVLGQPAPAVEGGVVLAGFGSGDIVALRADSGVSLWSDTLGASNGRASVLDLSSIHALPVIDNGTAYVMSMGPVFGAFDMRSGRRLWERTVSGKNGPAISGGWMFVVSGEQKLAAVDPATGQVRWSVDLPRFVKPNKQKGAISWNGPLIAGGNLYLTSDNKQLVAVDPADGKIVQEIKLEKPSSLAPVAAAGILLVVTNDGTLTAYGPG